jgi:hypothetical protein
MSGEYNPDDLRDSAEEADEMDGALIGTITDVSVKPAVEVFGSDNIESDPDKPVYVVSIETEAVDATIDETFSAPKNNLSWANPEFKLAKFRNQYGDVPHEGLEVELTYNENGFLRVKL